MVDISNRTLALLLVAAVVVSLGSTVVSLNKLDEVSVTGFATESATADLEIEGSIAIEFLVDSVNFGTGFTDPVGSADNTCELFTDGSTGTSNTSGFCVGFITDPAPFEIKNIGNQPVNLDLASNATAAEFITGGSEVTPEPSFEFALREKDTGACTGVLTDSFTEFTGGSTDQGACTELDFGSGSSELFIDLSLLITTDADTGARAATITATAS